MAEEISNEDLKDLMHAVKLIRTNIENWKYVEANSHLVERKQLEQTIEQMLGTFAPMMDALQMAFELQALTSFDPHDLI